jgi:DNA-damage-inducible protein D
VEKNMSDLASNPPVVGMAVFKGKRVRRTIYNNEWWFSVIDVVEVLTGSVNARDYWFKMKIREKDEADVELSTFCRQLNSLRFGW